MLNYGVTGALVEGLAVSDLFVVKGAINHDFDTSCIDDVLPHQYCDVDSVALPLSMFSCKVISLNIIFGKATISHPIDIISYVLSILSISHFLFLIFLYSYLSW